MLNLCGGLLVVVVFNKPLAFFSAKMRVVISYVSPRYSQHIVGLWKKEIQRVSKNKSNSLSGRKGFFHNNVGNGKKNCKLNRTASVFQHIFFFFFFFEATKKIFLAGSKTQHLPRVKLSLFSKHPFGAFTDENLPLFSLDGYLADCLPRIQKEDEWDTVAYFF